MKFEFPSKVARTLLHTLACAIVIFATGPAQAANYPLELVSPRAVGTAPAAGEAAITGTHRIFKAYPGLEYNIRAVVIGGAYPYSFSLSNAPQGMSIDSRTGLIVWPNPQTSSTPAITVTDSEGTSISSSWTINVTTSGFHFVDSVNGQSHTAATGTINSPWRNIIDIADSPSATAGEIVYFRSGTYNALDLPRGSVGTAWERVSFSASEKPVVWLAYPGESPVIDFGFNPGVENGVIIRLNEHNIYIDGFETKNSRVIGFQLTSGPGSDHRVLRRLRMRDHNLIRADLEGTNAAYIMTTTAFGEWSDYTVVQDCEFFNAPADMAMKTYSQRKMLIEGNVLRDIYYGTELKFDMPRFTYRGNIHYNIPGRAIGGNMHAESTSGEILFNLVNAPSGEAALDVNQDGMATRIDTYRNTFVGRVRVRNTYSENGPFRFYNNVIVSNDAGTPSGSHIHHEQVHDASRVQGFDNLAGYPNDNIVDSAGSLTAAYQQFIGTRGYQIGGASSPPSPPTNFVVE